MQKTDLQFFEAYKRTDALCTERYGWGVSDYIARMEAQGLSADPVYRSLKHLRHLRNQIAHESVDGGVCTAEDAAALEEFHRLLLRGKDPLAVRPKTRRPKPAVQTESRGAAPWIVLALWGLILIVTLILFLR